MSSHFGNIPKAASWYSPGRQVNDTQGKNFGSMVINSYLLPIILLKYISMIKSLQTEGAYIIHCTRYRASKSSTNPFSICTIPRRQVMAVFRRGYDSQKTTSHLRVQLGPFCLQRVSVVAWKSTTFGTKDLQREERADLGRHHKCRLDAHDDKKSFQCS